MLMLASAGFGATLTLIVTKPPMALYYIGKLLALVR